MSIDLAVQSAVREVVREEIRAALREHSGSSTDSYLTYAQAATFTATCTSTITAWIRSGLLPVHGNSRAKRVLRSELVAFMAKGARVEPEKDSDAQWLQQATRTIRRVK